MGRAQKLKQMGLKNGINWIPIHKLFENHRKIASEASFAYILNGQKLIKNAKKLSILASFWIFEACGQTVLPDRSLLIG